MGVGVGVRVEANRPLEVAGHIVLGLYILLPWGGSNTLVGGNAGSDGCRWRVRIFGGLQNLRIPMDRMDGII